MKLEVRKMAAEALGTFVLVAFGCGTAVFTGMLLGDPVSTASPGLALALNYLTIAFAFGLVIVAMAYVIGPVSGCHINPAVSLGMAINKRITWGEFCQYVLAQIVGAVAGAALLFGIQKGLLLDKVAEVTSLGQNGFDEASAVGLNTGGAVIAEIVLTFVFVLTVLAATAKKNAAGKKAGLIIGLTLTLVHILGIALTGTSVNPARSFGPALFVLGDAIKQVWVFILAPLVGAALAALFAKFVLKTEEEKTADADTAQAEQTQA